MGCCESCGVCYSSHRSSPLPRKFRLVDRLGLEDLSTSTMDRSPSPLKDSLEDGFPGDDFKADEIESQYEGLLGRSDWKTQASSAACEVKSVLLEDSASPVMLLTLDFGTTVEINTVWKALYEQEGRLAWDTGVLALQIEPVTNNIWTVYSISKMPFPFSNRDFSERRVLKSCSDGLQIVHYSISEAEGGRPACEKCERAMEFFSLARIVMAEGTTKLQLMNQCDLKLPVAQDQITVFAARQIMAWSERLKRRVLDS